MVGTFYGGGFYKDFTVSDGTTAFIADEECGLKAVNCTDLENPFLISSHELNWRIIRVAIEDDRVYLATLRGGIRILTTERS